MKKTAFSALCIFIAITVSAQLNIDSASLIIQPGAAVRVYGDVTSNVNIGGTGVLQLKGTAQQNIDMGGNTIPNLELDNDSNAILLNTNARIGNSFLFTKGKFKTGNLNLVLSPAAIITGAASSRFVWTNGTGQLKKELSGDILSFQLPVGENGNYRPAYLTTSGSTYTNADFGILVTGTADPNKPPMSASFIKTYWPVNKTGIMGGVVTLEGQYIDPADVNGTKANLVGYYYNGTDWSSAGETHNAITNRVSAIVSANAGSLSGINKFILVGAKALLNGAYDAASGLMTDNLRTLPLGSPASMASFPRTDPYRAAPYNTGFTHVNNPNTDSILNSTVVTAQPLTPDNIVDWVYLELRNLAASPGNTILQTRSALIQRDGDIVDMDGYSPVTFNNLADGNYILAIRHRNHLGLSIDQSSPRNITETRSTAFTTKLIDFRTATDAQLFGTAAAYTTASHPTLTTVNLLWGGDASGNGIVRYQGSNGPTGANDRVVILQSLGNVESNILSPGYFRGDLNMNRVLRYQGSNGPAAPNDRVVLLQILGNVESTIRTQSLPN